MKHLVLPVLALFTLAACGDKDDDTGTSGEEGGGDGCLVDVTAYAPGADANNNVPIAEPVELAATVSAPDCSGELSVHWDQLDGPADIVFSDNDTSTASSTSFETSTEGLYVVQAEACFDNGCGTSESLAINVATPQEAPVADAGGNQSASVGQLVEVDGSGSYDPEGSELTYEWSLAVVPETSVLTQDDLKDATSAVASFVPDDVGIYVVELVVNDGAKDSTPSQATITVGD